MKGRPRWPAVLLLLVGCAGVAQAGESREESALEAPPNEPSKTEVNKNVTDPVSLTWSLKLQNNVTFLDIEGHGTQVQDELKLQPTLPVRLTRALKLIARPEFVLVDSKPFTDGSALDRATGVGDTILDLVLSPVSDPWLLALGPTFVFPTASDDQTGNGKWQAGPGGVLGYRSKTWIAGLIAQQWWSFAGSSSRPAVSELHLQYIVGYFFGDGWSIGTSPTIEVDWRATSGNRVTFPFGPSVSKVVKLAGVWPVKLELQGLYAPVHPSRNGEQFQVQVVITPVIPALLPLPLFGS